MRKGDRIMREAKDIIRSITPIGRLVALSEAADRNGWEIIDVQANETDAVVLFDRGNSPFGSDHRFGTSEFHFAAGYFGQGHYDMTRDEAQLDYKARCDKEFV